MFKNLVVDILMFIPAVNVDNEGIKMKIEVSLSEFFSPGDERRFFEAFKSIRGIQSVVGSERSLIVVIILRYLNRDSIIELIALLWRYQIRLHPLRELAKSKKFSWMSEPQWYWHKDMFSDI